MDSLRRDFLPEDLSPLFRSIAFDGTIAVQARQSLQETEWLLELADAHPFIRGVVGWVDLCGPSVDAQLGQFASHPALVGVRHVVHDEPDDEFMLRSDFQNGIAQLRPLGLTYDLLLFPKHLPVAVRLVERFPQQQFVLDHVAKPRIRDGEFLEWQSALAPLAEFPNVSCKLSGLVTEANWYHWRAEDFHRYLDVVVELFGTKRVMIGSDWPVCTLSGDYASIMKVVIDYVNQFHPQECSAIFGENCAEAYQLDDPLP